MTLISAKKQKQKNDKKKKKRKDMVEGFYNVFVHYFCI